MASAAAADLQSTLSLRDDGLRGGGGGNYLVVVEDDTSSLVPLPDDGTVTSGRDPDATVRLRDPASSRNHAALRMAGGRAAIEDLGSHNGTRVNGQAVRGTRAIAGGDVISIGKATIIAQLAAVDRPERPVLIDLG